MEELLEKRKTLCEINFRCVASVCKHAFVGSKVPLLDVGIGRTGVYVGIKYCSTCYVAFVTSAKNIFMNINASGHEKQT